MDGFQDAAAATHCVVRQANSSASGRRDDRAVAGSYLARRIQLTSRLACNLRLQVGSRMSLQRGRPLSFIIHSGLRRNSSSPRWTERRSRVCRRKLLCLYTFMASKTHSSLELEVRRAAFAYLPPDCSPAARFSACLLVGWLAG